METEAVSAADGKEDLLDLDFSAALTTWKDIGLRDLQKRLDAQGIEVIDNQKENTVGRKRLAEQTREFKKISDEEKLSSFKVLLKAYQSEIDSLTKRSKVAENAFLGLYKIFAEAPDPYPLLDAAVEYAAKGSETKKLQEELKKKSDECAEFKEQTLTLKDIERERSKAVERADRLEARFEDTLKEHVSQKEAEMNAIYDERIRNYEDREKDLQRQVDMGQEQLRDLRVSNDTTEARLLDKSQRENQESVARRAEMEYLTANLQRANSRATEMELRNERLRAELENVKAGSDNNKRVRGLEDQVSELQSEAYKLMDTLEKHKAEAEHQKSLSSKQLIEHNNSITEHTKEIQRLKEKVAQCSDYDEMKRELDIIKFVEFGSLDPNEDDDQPRDTETSSLDPNSEPNHEKSLEGLLVAKNRKLQDELTSMRVSRDELKESVTQLQSALESAQGKLSGQQSLTDRLENDLSRVNSELKGAEKGSKTEMADNTLMNMNASGKGTTERDDKEKSRMTAGDASILPIITKQRDRFRQRNSELEEEVRRHIGLMDKLRAEVKRLQEDNVKMYEKVRYTQYYRDSDQGAGLSSRSRSPFPSAPNNNSDDGLGRYHNMYEESMNPFTAFKGREHTRAIGLLNPFERILLNASGIILGSRWMRTGFVTYALALHLFVFLFVWGSLMRGHSDTTTTLRPESS